MPERVTIVGCGVIGGSLGLALRSLGGPGRYQVVAFDRDASRARQAVELGAADRSAMSLEEAVAKADLVVLAVPAEAVVELARRASSAAPGGAVLTDVASVKGHIVEELDGRLPGGQAFVGGHPMAGSERAGLAGADPYLFQNAVYVLTPTASTPPAALDQVTRLVASIGAHPVHLSPSQHDAAVGVVSHLPHVVASCLVLAAGASEDEGIPAFELAATGFRDATRLALGHEEVWLPVLALNAPALSRAIAAFRRVLDRVERALVSGDRLELESLLVKARRTRAALRLPAKGYGAPTWDLVVRLPDRPGAIAAVSGALGDRGINIADIEILRVREGEAGTLRLGFNSEQTLRAALEVLRGRGFATWVR
ncbi:MAG: prephenate dehydrogenase [Bacillota bacterium]